MKFKVITGTFILFGMTVPKITFAHCPLCTAGAGALAVLAASTGVPGLVVATFIGGFAFALGLWMAKVIKKKYIPWQDRLVVVLVYLLTVVPLWSILVDYKILSIPALGIDKYTQTVAINIYLVGAIIGVLVLLISPYLSRQITRLKGKQLFPYQGIIITLVLLGVIPLILDTLFLV